MNKAKGNIIILEHSSFAKEWLDFLPRFDLAITKTQYSYDVFKSYLSNKKLEYSNIVNIGWKSPNIYLNYEKDYDEVLLYCKNDFNYEQIIDNWDPKFPNLNIVLDTNITVKKREQANLIYQNEIKNEEFHKLFSTCGVHLCLSEYQTYDNMITQAKLGKSVIVGMNKSNSGELLDDSFAYCISGKKKKNSYGIGSKFTYNLDGIMKAIKSINTCSEEHLEHMGMNAYRDAINMQNKFNELFQRELKRVLSITMTRKFNKKMYSDSELPTISIVTPTYNRKSMFRLAIYNYNSIDYPRDKIEWIIVDDSDESERLDGIVPDKEYCSKNNMDINYIKLDKKLTIGSKRNIGCEVAKNKVIVFMDDDDYYYPESVKNRVMAMMRTDKKICCVSTIGCFEINDFVSAISIPSVTDIYYNRISIASLCFKKEIWEESRFMDSDKSEAELLINNNINNIEEISWEKNIVSLIHSKNKENNRIKGEQEKNGCHYGFSEKLFNFIITLDKNKDIEEKLKKSK